MRKPSEGVEFRPCNMREWSLRFPEAMCHKDPPPARCSLSQQCSAQFGTHGPFFPSMARSPTFHSSNRHQSYQPAYNHPFPFSPSLTQERLNPVPLSSTLYHSHQHPLAQDDLES